ncbi:hypothetical protein FG386_001837 [Cryptosporidium ryanae]|uniref:uncharacterized protein n=1 Tax=Cryptosporidium ryanae TaxID=515981 RepID=UPI00351A5653|nr:hypothetical protein FG386_001837 [Cryptosporidium ryanae]
MDNESRNAGYNRSIRCTGVKFDGICQTNPEYFRKYRETILRENNFNKLIEKVDSIHKELSSLDSFSSVIPILNTKNGDSEVDVTFKLVESKIKCSVGSTINKQGKVGFELSAFIPNLLGTLSSTRLTLETFGRRSREFNLGLFTPMLLNSDVNMSYCIFNNKVDDRSTPPYANNYFGSKLKFSDKLGVNSLSLESSIRGTHANIIDNKNHYIIEKAPIRTLKNSIGYSWNKARKKFIESKDGTESDTLSQLSIEYAGFNSDVKFIKIEAFQKWRSTLKRHIKRPFFLSNLCLNLSLGLGILLPNFSKGKFELKTTIHDRFFLGGNSGFHKCLMGFASGSVGPCLKEGVDLNKDLNSKPKDMYVGSNGYLSGELTLQYPLNMNKYGFSIEPNLISYVNAATIINGNNTISMNNCNFSDKNKILENFKRTIRASTGIGELE